MALFQSQRHDMSQKIATKEDIAIISQAFLSLVPFKMHIVNWDFRMWLLAALKGWPQKGVFFYKMFERFAKTE